MALVRKPNPMPYTKSLFLGLYGEEIRQLQEWLNELNDFYRFSKKLIKETGYFGFDTLKQVRAFQTFCHMTPTGAYDRNTHTQVEGKWFNMLEYIRIQRNEPLIKQFQPEKAPAKTAPKVPTAKSADPFATRQWTK